MTFVTSLSKTLNADRGSAGIIRISNLCKISFEKQTNLILKVRVSRTDMLILGENYLEVDLDL